MSPAGGPELKDGQALDRLTESVEKWARSYNRLDDAERWDEDFRNRFASSAKTLARKSTPEARPFGVRDWVLAVVLWLAIGAFVFIGSILLMQLDGTWRIVFAVFAGLIALVGIWQSYLEVTSAKRAADKLAKKEEWLLAVSRKSMTRILNERLARRRDR